MRELRIGLLWHQFGRPNLGCDALSRSNIAILRSAALSLGVKPRFVLFGKPGQAKSLDSDVENGPFLRMRELATLNTREYMDGLRSCDIIVDICAGDGFTSIYGKFLFFLHSITKILAIRSGRPLVFSPQTIGPFESAWTRTTARWILSRAMKTFARDSMSTAAFRALDVESPLEEVIDVAFRLPFTARSRPDDDPNVKVGINVSGLLYLHGNRFNLTINYPDFSRRVVEELSKKPNTEIWLVSHVHHDGEGPEDDYPVIEQFAKQFLNVKIAPKFVDSEEAKSWIADLDLFIGGRMHACIGAFSALVPVLPVAYSRKFNGLFQTLDYPYVVDGRSLSTEDAVRAVIDGYDNRGTLKTAVTQGMGIARTRLAKYEKSVAATLQQVAAER